MTPTIRARLSFDCLEDRCVPAAVGFLDGVFGDVVQGWAYDTDVSSVPINVRIIVDGGAWSTTVSTPDFRSDVNQSFGITGNHGFAERIPLNVMRSQPQHVVEVRALNLIGGGEVLLGTVSFSDPFVNTPETSAVTPQLRSLPANFNEGATITGTNLFYYRERSDFLLTQSLPVDVDQPGNYLGTSTQFSSLQGLPSSPYPNGGSIASGQIINSYYVHFNPPTGAVTFVDGTIRFEDEIIVGIIADTTNLNQSVSVLNLSPGSYSSDDFGDLEIRNRDELGNVVRLGNLDSVILSSDRKEARFALRAAGLDGARIITIAANDPPVITSSATVSVPENVAFVQTVTAVDPDNDPITFSISGGADSSLFTINGSTGQLSFLTAPDFESPSGANGNLYDVIVRATSQGNLMDEQRLQITVTDVEENVPSPGVIVVGSGPGPAATVKVYDAETGALLQSLQPFGAFTGGVKVATGDLNGDGIHDVVAVPASPALSIVTAYDGTDFSLMGSFLAFTPLYSGGVNVAVGDVNGDGNGDVVIGAATGLAHVRVVDSTRMNERQADAVIAPSAQIANFFAFTIQYTGGLTVASGDVNNDGRDDIVAGAATGLAHVRVIDSRTAAQIQGEAGFSDLFANFYAFNVGYTGGIYVASGDLDGDGLDDVIAGAATGLAHVRAVDATNLGGITGEASTTDLFANFFAFGLGFQGGVRVGAVTGSDGDADILASTGFGSSMLRVLDGLDQTELDAFDPFVPFNPFGIYVAGA